MGLHKKLMLSFVILVLSTGTANSTAMLQLGLKDLATGAEKIVQATVTAVVQQWNADHTVIYTYVRMVIKDDLLGSEEDNEIIIKQPGGSVGTLTLKVLGCAEYKVGEQNILFLSRDPATPAAYQTLGMYQGKYTIYTDNQQVARVSQDTTQSRTLYKAAGSMLLETGNSMTLDDFKQLVIDYRNNGSR